MTLPLVLLPGMMCDARLFGPQIDALSPERAIHVAPISAHDIVGALAEDVLTHAPPVFALAGLSMGGIVAMEIMATAPERVDRLALMDTNPCAEEPRIQERRAPQIERVRAGQLRDVMRDEMKPHYLADKPGKQQVLDLCMDMAKSLGPDVFIRQSIALRDRLDRQDTLKDVQVPTLVLCGEADKLCPLERHELMHALVPGSRLEIISGAGHLPTLEAPEKTNAALVRWLAQS